MRRYAFAAFAVLLGISSALSAAPEYEAVEDQSNIHFSVPLMAVSKVTGKFMKYDLELWAGDKPDLSRARAKAVIEIASIDTGNDSWDAKLRAPAWFDAAKYPKIEFVSSRVRRVGDRWEADGKLTMHGVTKEITLPFKFEGRFEGPNPRRAHRDPCDLQVRPARLRHGVGGQRRGEGRRQHRDRRDHDPREARRSEK